MCKKIGIILVIFLLMLSSPASGMVDDRQNPTYNPLISTISSLWKKENQLRQTWSYTGLTAFEIAAPVLKFSTLGIWGVLGRIWRISRSIQYLTPSQKAILLPS